MILRDYQTDIIDRLEYSWQHGSRSVMVQMPTGTGKTVVAVDVVARHIGSDQDNRVIVVAHRHEILEQIRETLAHHGLAAALAGGIVRVESIQSLARLADRQGACRSKTDCGQATMVVIDEAHHATARTYRMLWQMFGRAKFMGLTATPCRMKQEGFTELFDTLICSRSVRTFIQEGWLAHYDYICVRPDSEMRTRIETLKKRGADGDYQRKELGGVMDNRACIGQLYNSYKKYADGRQGIIYAIDRTHAAHIREYYRERGESVALIDAKTPEAERHTLLYKYSKGEIRILVNCEIYTEGYDAPFVEFIQMARPTLSLSKYLQQVGRGLRPNKEGRRTVILDNVAMYYMFGLPDAPRDWQKMFRHGQIAGRHTVNGRFGTNGNADGQLHRYSTSPTDSGHDLGMMLVGDEDAARKKNAARNGRNINDGYYFDFEAVEYYGLDRFRDTCTGLILPERPRVLNVGDATFIEETDGWHLRSRIIPHIPFDIGDIAMKDKDVVMTEQPSGKQYILFWHGRHRYLMRLIGTQDDGSELMATVADPDTVYRRKGRNMTVHRRQTKGNWEYSQYDRYLYDTTVTPRNYEPHTVGYDKYIRVVCRNKLYGWAMGDIAMCRPMFPEIICFMNDRQVLVRRAHDNRQIIVDYKGRYIAEGNDTGMRNIGNEAWHHGGIGTKQPPTT